MRAILLAALLCAGPAFADATPQPAAAPPQPVDPHRQTPQSIWRPVADGGLEHLQSGMNCPLKVGRFVRVETIIYDGFGFDVSCGYNSSVSAITLYLTRGPELQAAYAEAKLQLEQHGEARHPKLLRENRVQEGGLDWLKAEYAEDEDKRSDIWMTVSAGWMIEYRATYPASEQAVVAAELADLTRQLQATAGARLALCARAAPPERRGTPVTDAAQLSKFGTVGALLGATSQVAAQERHEPAASLAFCPEAGFPDGHLLFWRGVRADGSDAGVDRMTLMTMGPPPVLESAPDSFGDLVASEAGGKPVTPHWTASVTQHGRTAVFGYYEGRPPARTLAELMRTIVAGKATPLTSYAVDGKNITLSLPGKP